MVRPGGCSASMLDARTDIRFKVQKIDKTSDKIFVLIQV